MTSIEIRKSFLDFFKSKSHRIVSSFPVVPHNDPTLLFTNAGMNQFKDVFLGTGSRDYKRAANTQKCIRVSGKHNDLEEVGIDTYHHTFFEMLGNWSFGDYYKKEAIQWAWELLTEVWKLDPKRLYATVYRTDDEAYEIWKDYLPEDRIQRFDEKDNFWEMGATGPCGPCSEIHYDRTSDFSGASLVNADSPDVVEIWNLVFIQFNRNENGELEPLAQKFVDTGMGFERVCAILQNVKSNYDTDIFLPLLGEIQRLTGVIYTTSLDKQTDIAMRVIADHIRALSFAIADGVSPGNEGRNYVIRRILRRASRYARNLGVKEPMLYKLVPVLVRTMGDYFTELKQNQQLIQKVIYNEEVAFLHTMERGLEKIEEIISHIVKENKEKIISGQDAFLLYDTFGFPLDLTELIARERGLNVDTEEFDKKMQEQKERSRASQKNTSTQVKLPIIDETSEFTGYDLTTASSQAKVVFVKDNLIVLDKTPFYAESGGQLSDIGVLFIGSNSFSIVDVQKNGNAIFHISDTDFTDVKVGDNVMTIIDMERRKSTARNHTATHLLHEALCSAFGEHVKQAGSLVSPNYLRFDFNHFEKISLEDLKNIENTVNTLILLQQDVKTETLSIEEAKKNTKAKMFFGDKYGDLVRTVSIGDFSVELCGGTHVKNTSEICMFKIISEASVAAGIRRIEAVTGKQAFEYVKKLEEKHQEKDNVIAELSNKIRSLEKEIEKINIANLQKNTDQLIDNAITIGNTSVLIKQMQLTNLDQLRTTAEKVRESFAKNGICLIISVIDDKVQLACAVTDDLKDKVPAGKLVGEVAKLFGGGGGGKPHLATAGGKDITKIDSVLETDFYNIVKNMLEK